MSSQLTTRERINQVIAERQALFRRAADGFLPPDERAQIKLLSQELEKLWDQQRREGHPPAVQPVYDEWDRPRRGRKRSEAAAEHRLTLPGTEDVAA